jgi:hypothetical protein
MSEGRGLGSSDRRLLPELQRMADIDRVELTSKPAEFVDFYTRPARQLSLRLG